MPPPRIAYLVSLYPDVSHTFIQREIVALRELGADVQTFSIRRAKPERLLSDLDRAEARRTRSIVPTSPLRFASVHVRTFLRRPSAYLGALGYALRNATPGARARLWSFFYFLEAVDLWRECAARRLRHIHVHFPNVAADVADIASRLAELERGSGALTWSLTVHGPTEFYDVTGHRLAAKIERAEFTVCISDFARSQLMSFVAPEIWPRLHVIHCGVEPGPFEVLDPARPDGPLEVLCIGRLVPVKGQILLVDALARLRASGVDARLTLVGDGPDAERLRRAAADARVSDLVRFDGSVARDRIPSYLARAHVLCLPSFAEGVPVVLMEAMAAGLPVISTAIAGIPELIENSVSGILIRPGRVDELVAALSTLASDPELRTRLGDAGRDVVRKEFDLEQNVAELFSVFQRRETPAATL